MGHSLMNGIMGRAIPDPLSALVVRTCVDLMLAETLLTEVRKPAFVVAAPSLIVSSAHFNPCGDVCPWCCVDRPERTLGRKPFRPRSVWVTGAGGALMVILQTECALGNGPCPARKRFIIQMRISYGPVKVSSC